MSNLSEGFSINQELTIYFINFSSSISSPNLAFSEDFAEMKNFLKKIGSNRRLAAERLEIDFKKPFALLAKLPAEARGEAPSEATNSIWWSREDSNLQPLACQASATTLELQLHRKIWLDMINEGKSMSRVTVMYSPFVFWKIIADFFEIKTS